MSIHGSKNIRALTVASMFALVSAHAYSEDVIIPLAVPTTGADAPLADPLVKGYRLAIKLANESGRLPGRVIADVQDDQDKPEIGASLARRWCGNPQVVGVVGNMASALVLAGSPIYEACGLVHITPTASNDLLTTKGWRMLFRGCSKNADQANEGVAWIRRNWPQVKTIAMIDTNDASSRNYTGAFSQAWKAAGGEVVDDQHVVAGTGDYRGTLTALLEHRPDLLLVGLLDTDGGIAIKQARELGFRGKFFGSDGVSTPNVVRIAGASAAEGLHVTNLGLDPAREAAATQFVAAYQREYGDLPSAYAASAYDDTMILIEAWRRAGGGADRIKLRNAIAAGRFDGVFGPLQFNQNGDLARPVISIYQVKDGKFAFVGKAT